MNSMLRKFSLLLLVFVGTFATAQTVNPKSDVKWPTGPSGCFYVPGTNSCATAVSGANGAFPSTGNLILTGDSGNDDDYGVIETPVATSGYTCTGSGTFTCVVNTTLSTAVGKWINMRGTTDFSPGNAHFPSYVELGTGYSLFQVTASTPGTSFTFTETLGAYTCSSSCGTVADASFNLPFATWNDLGFGSSPNIHMVLPDPVNIAGLDTNFTSLFPTCPTNGYIAIFGSWNDIQGGATYTTLEGHFASIWAKAHAIGCKVVQLTQSAAIVSQSSFGYPQEYHNMVKTEQWVEDQGPQSSLISSGQYWDYLVDVGSALHNAWDTAKIATNTGLGPAGAYIAASQLATVLSTGESSQGSKFPLYFAAPIGALNGYWAGWSIIPDTDSYNIFGVEDAEGNTVMNIDTYDTDHSVTFGNNGGNVAIIDNVTDNHESAITVNQSNVTQSAGSPVETLNKTFHIETGTGWGNDISTLWQYDTSNYDGVNFGAVITSLGSATLNGGFAEINGAPYDNFHFDGTGDSCFYVKTLANLNAATDPVCPTSKAFSVGTTGEFNADANGDTWMNTLNPTTLYSAAGTALPTCGSSTKGETAIVSDATSPTYMGAYTSGGAVTAQVICSYNGSAYGWLTH